MKFAERISSEVAIPAVNQLRYALCHVLEGDAEAALRHCVRARYDAYEAAVGFFLADNRTGCRFITVDAYRNAVGFYERNDFARMLTKETEDPNAPTVPLFFDLKRLMEQAA